jgi:dimethylaniline monooxygenase (N-oxide forming)
MHTTDEGVYSPESFYAAVSRRDIQVFPSTHVEGFGLDGRSVILSTGQSLPADVVILATGFTSSWSRIFDGSSLFIVLLGT